MKLTYIFHSGFAIEGENSNILIDYFMDTGDKPGYGYVHDVLLKQDKPLYILSSHFHEDHFNPEILLWKKKKTDITYIFSKDILKRKRAGKEDVIFLKKGEKYETPSLQVEAFGSTDIGISFYIIFEGRTIFHAGDLNNWHWKDESTPEEVKEAEDHFLDELAALRKQVHALDLAMFPVDARMGTDHARGAEQFLEAIPTRLFAPMHFEPDYGPVRDFRAFAAQHGVDYFEITHKGQDIYF